MDARAQRHAFIVLSMIRRCVSRFHTAISHRVRCCLPAVALSVWVTIASSAHGGPPTRSETLEIARSFAEHRWEASEKNVLHGPDKSRVEVHTPDAGETRARESWTVGATNTGVPYKWGGFDSLASFDAGIRAGKAAGDLYSSEKRRKADAAVSAHAVGIDCSGFISRCWKLPKKYGTATLPSLCKPLASPAELRPGDIMNTAGSHVILFARWLDDAKTRALFYEAEPYSKVIASEHEIASLVESGFKPWRYRQMRE